MNGYVDIGVHIVKWQQPEQSTTKAAILHLPRDTKRYVCSTLQMINTSGYFFFLLLR